MAFTAEVAQIASVSPSTVSLVVNGKGRVSPQTRQRVREAIRRLGYDVKPKQAESRSPFEVAVIYCPDTVHDGEVSKLTGQVIEGVRGRLVKAGGHMSLYQGQADVTVDILFRQRVEAGDVNGAILIGPGPRDGYLDYLVGCPMPLVVINRQPRYNEFSSVSVDYHGLGKLAMGHLLSQGHERIALLLGPRREWLWRSVVAGSMKGLKDRGLSPAFMQHVDARNVPTDMAQRLVDSGVTAVFTGDYTAAVLLERFHEMGVSVPGRMSVLGFDDLGFISSTGLKLTSIGYDKQRLGRLAIDFVQRLAQSKRKLGHLSASVCVRMAEGQTVAPPAEP